MKEGESDGEKTKIWRILWCCIVKRRSIETTFRRIQTDVLCHYVSLMCVLLSVSVLITLIISLSSLGCQLAFVHTLKFNAMLLKRAAGEHRKWDCRTSFLASILWCVWLQQNSTKIDVVIIINFIIIFLLVFYTFSSDVLVLVCWFAFASDKCKTLNFVEEDEHWTLNIKHGFSYS